NTAITGSNNGSNITINAMPVAPTGTAAQSFCLGASHTVADLTPTGTIKWYATSNGISALPPSTSLNDNTHYYATQTVNGCESSARLDVTATILTDAPTPTGTATQPFCSSASH